MLCMMTQMILCRWAAELAGGPGPACTCSDRHHHLVAMSAKDRDGASAPGCQGGGLVGVP